jgi:hypothetical protein
MREVPLGLSSDVAVATKVEKAQGQFLPNRSLVLVLSLHMPEVDINETIMCFGGNQKSDVVLIGPPGELVGALYEL